MDWIPPALAVLGTLAAVFLGSVLNQRALDKAWKRDSDVRREDRLREDARRWDAERIDAYSSLWAASLALTTRLRDLTPYWDASEEPPREKMHAFESHRDIVAKAHSHAMLLGSSNVRATLQPLWLKTLEIGTALDHPSDGSISGDDLAIGLSRGLGQLLGELNTAVRDELGIDLISR